MLRAGLGILIWALTWAGCGPTMYLYKLTAQARRAVAEAETVGARDAAPYEYWSAVQYLHMAREKAGEADYQIAIRYCERSYEMSVRARRLATRQAQTSNPREPVTARGMPKR